LNSAADDVFQQWFGGRRCWSDKPVLIIRIITSSYQLTQAVWSRCINVIGGDRDKQTDRQHTVAIPRFGLGYVQRAVNSSTCLQIRRFHLGALRCWTIATRVLCAYREKLILSLEHFINAYHSGAHLPKLSIVLYRPNNTFSAIYRRQYRCQCAQFRFSWVMHHVATVTCHWTWSAQWHCHFSIKFLYLHSGPKVISYTLWNIYVIQHQRAVCRRCRELPTQFSLFNQ